MKFRYCKPGEHVIEYNAVGTEFFILIKGQASVIIPKKRLKNLKLAKSGHGHGKRGKGGKADASKEDQKGSKEHHGHAGEKQPVEDSHANEPTRTARAQDHTRTHINTGRELSCNSDEIMQEMKVIASNVV